MRTGFNTQAIKNAFNSGDHGYIASICDQLASRAPMAREGRSQRTAFDDTDAKKLHHLEKTLQL